MRELQETEWMLLLKALKGECSIEEQERFEEWLTLDKNNRELFGRVELDWKRTGEITIEDHANPEEVWGKISDSINESQGASKSVVNWRPWMSYAAAVVLLIAFSVLFFTNQTSQRVPEYAMVETSPAGISKMILSDGSKVWLAEQSSLEYSDFSNSKSRKVILKGKAYFEVARNEAKPFIIETSSSKVEVLGTAFNLDASQTEKEVELTVTHGKVAFSSLENTSERMILTIGEMAKLDMSDGTLSKSDLINPNVLSWKTGILTFDNAPLKVVCKTISKYYKSNISVLEEAPQDLFLTVTFDNQPLEEVVEIIAETLDLTLVRDKGFYFK